MKSPTGACSESVSDAESSSLVSFTRTNRQKVISTAIFPSEVSCSCQTVALVQFVSVGSPAIGRLPYICVHLNLFCWSDPQLQFWPCCSYNSETL